MDLARWWAISHLLAWFSAGPAGGSKSLIINQSGRLLCVDRSAAAAGDPPEQNIISAEAAPHSTAPTRPKAHPRCVG